MRWGALTRALDALPHADFDLVHIHTPFVAHYAGTRFARRAGIPCVATYHTFFEEYLHHYVPVLPRRARRACWRAPSRARSAQQVQALIAPSEPMRAVLSEYGVTTPIHVLPTGLAADRFGTGDGAAFRARAGIARRPAAADLCRPRGAREEHRLPGAGVRAGARRACRRRMLVIAGEGPAREALRAQVAALGLSAHVHFAGYLERDTQLLDCYAAADVFVFASRTETQGLVLLEAMAQGAPVVSTAELGTRSILLPDSGAVVVPEERDAFAAAVVRVLRDPDLRAAACARAAVPTRAPGLRRRWRGACEIYGSCTRAAAHRAAGRTRQRLNRRDASLPARQHFDRGRF